MSVEFTGKKACIAPEGVFIIGTYDEDGVPNAMNAAWGAQSDYDEITLFLAKHKTTENIKHTKAFTVDFATKDTVEIADYFGVETGSKVNKIEKAGCHVHKSAHVNAPIIEEFPVTLECECVSYSDETGILVGRAKHKRTGTSFKVTTERDDTDKRYKGLYAGLWPAKKDQEFIDEYSMIAGHSDEQSVLLDVEWQCIAK